MATSLSNMFLKGIAVRSLSRPFFKLQFVISYSNSLPLTWWLLNGLFYCTRYSNTVSNDSDTHDDFKPANKLEGSGISLSNVIEQDVKDNPVMVCMKGVPDFPQCGFCSLAVRVLKHYDVSISARNILEDPELKNAVKAFSNWPTFPQIFIKGEFIGGSDIILNMHQTGELKESLKILPPSSKHTPKVMKF